MELIFCPTTPEEIASVLMLKTSEFNCVFPKFKELVFIRVAAITSE